MAELYGKAPGTPGGRCPGDGDEEKGVPACRRWEATFEPGLSREERVAQLKMCEMCDGRGPLAEGEGVAAAADGDAAIVERVERVVMERQSGKPPDLSELSSLEWELVIVWDCAVDAYRRGHEARVAQMYEVLVSMLSHR